MAKKKTTKAPKATRINTDPTPVYAAVGLSDIVVERLRDLGEQALKLGQETGRQLRPENVANNIREAADDLNNQVSKLLHELTSQVQTAPETVAGEAGEQLVKLEKNYQDLAERGEKLVERIRGQQATQELVHQVGGVVKQGKGLLTTARKGAKNTQSAAKATITTGRRQAADAVADVVYGEDVAVVPASEAAPARTSTTRTTTARKSTARKSTAAKSTAARKTAAKSTSAKSTTAAKSSTAKSSTAKSSPAKSTPAKSTTKSTPKKSTTKSTAAKSTSKSTGTGTSTAKRTTTAAPAAQSAPAKDTAKDNGTDNRPNPTETAAKRTVTTARNTAADTAQAASKVAEETTKAVAKAGEATRDAAVKVGD